MTELDDPDRLGFVGEPFDPGTWITTTTTHQPVVERSARTLEDAVDDLLRDVRSSMVAAHASVLESLHRLQYRTAAPLLAPTTSEGRSW